MRYFMKVFIFAVLNIFLFAGLSHAEKVTFVKEYTYQASELDSKASCRTISLEMVKRLLLEELGTYLISETEVKNFKLTKDQITTYSAGIVSAEVVDEKWDGKTYYLKAKVSADPAEVAKSLQNIANDKQKAKTLEDVRKKAAEYSREIERLKKELAIAKTDNKKVGQKAETQSVEKYTEAVKRLSATDWIDKGLNFIDLGNYSSALNAFTKAIELYPKNFWSYFNRGFAYDMLGNQQQAINDYNKAIELAPKLAEDANVYILLANFYFLRGVSYDDLGNLQQAIKDYNKAIELVPKHAGAYHGRGIVYNKLGIYQQALNDLNKAIELDPQLDEVYFTRGVTYHSLGIYSAAINDYNRAIELKPNFADAYYNRGLAYGRLKNGEAIYDLKTAAKLGHKEAQDFLRGNGIGW